MRLRAALALMLVGVLGSPAVAKLPPTRGWIETRTEHFEIYGNARAKQVGKIAADLERFRTVLQRITSGFDFSADVPTSVYAFKSDRELTPYKLNDKGEPMNASGYFLERPLRKYIVIDVSAGEHLMRTIYHEYVHSLMDQTFGALPLWLNEGLAEYYSTFRFRPSSSIAEVGHPMEAHLYHLNNYGLIPIAELFETTHDSSTYNEGKRQGSFYAQSWLLVHYLVATDERRKRFGEFLSKLYAGADSLEALKESFGVEPAALEQQLAEYRSMGSNYYWFKLDERIDRVIPEAQPMDPGDVFFHLGDLLAHRGPSHASHATEHLEGALAADGPKGLVYSSLGVAADAAGEPKVAERWYRKAVDATGDDPVLLTRLAGAVLDRYLRENPETAGQAKVPDQVAEARSLYRHALELDPLCAEAMAGMGRSYLFGGDDHEPGLKLLASAATVRPFRTDVLHDLATLLARAGRYEAAWTVIERQLLPKAGSSELVSHAQSWVVHAVLNKAMELAAAGDRQAAVDLLNRMARRTGEPRLTDPAGEVRRLIEASDAEGIVILGDGEDAGYVNGLIGRYNGAVKLLQDDRLAEALEMLDETSKNCTHAELCSQIAATADEIRAALVEQRLIDRYNEAIALLNEGEQESAIAILRELAQATDPELREDSRSLLSKLGVESTEVAD